MCPLVTLRDREERWPSPLWSIWIAVDDVTHRLTGGLSSREHLAGKAPAAQLTRIDAADRLFSVPLTRITSVPECAVSSVGFLWGPAAVSLSCGVSVGLAEAPNWPGRPGTGYPSPADFRILVTPFRVTSVTEATCPPAVIFLPNRYDLLGLRQDHCAVVLSYLPGVAIASTLACQAPPASPLAPLR